MFNKILALKVPLMPVVLGFLGLVSLIGLVFGAWNKRYNLATLTQDMKASREKIMQSMSKQSK